MPQKFKHGDYVKTNPTDEEILEDGWQNVVGKVTDYDGFLDEYTVEFDAITLNGLSDDFIEACTLNYLMADERDFEGHQLLLAERRDTDAEYAKAKARITAIEQKLKKLGLIDTSEPDIDPLTDLEDPDDYEIMAMARADPERTQKVLLYRYEKSALLADHVKGDRSRPVSDADLMLEVALHHYGLDSPEEWGPDFVEDFAISHIPRKMLASPAEIEQMGENFTIFLQWLFEEEETDCGRLLVKTMRKAVPKMVTAAKDDSN